MNARLLFINEKEMNATGGQYVLASGVCNERFDSVYVRLEDVIDFIRAQQNIAAEDMISIQEQARTESKDIPDTTGQQAVWRELNFILSELSNYKNRP